MICFEHGILASQFTIYKVKKKKKTLFFVLNHVENRPIVLLSTQGLEQI